MPFTTFTELKTGLGSWLHRADLVTVIPDFISLNEAEMQRVLKCGEQETTTTLTLSQGSNSVTLPTGVQKIRRVRYLYSGVYVDLWPLALSPTYGDGVTQTPPNAMSIQGNTLVFANPADAQYSITVDYYAKFSPLSASVATNWILDSHPDAYLYGSLLQSAPFLGTDNRIELWGSAFNNIIDEINYLDFQKRNSQLQLVTDAPPMRLGAWGQRVWY